MLGRETCSHAVVVQVASWTAVVMSMESVQLFGFISVLSMLRAMATAAGFREAARRNGTPPRRWMDSLLSCFVMRHGNNSVAPCWWLCICGGDSCLLALGASRRLLLGVGLDHVPTTWVDDAWRVVEWPCGWLVHGVLFARRCAVARVALLPYAGAWLWLLAGAGGCGCGRSCCCVVVAVAVAVWLWP